MQLFSRLRHLMTRHRQNGQKPARRRAPVSRLRVEALEDRWLPSTLTVTSSLDSGAGSLRAEIAAASSGDEIVFDNSVHAITLKSELAVKKSLDIQGPGNANLVISGNNASRVFDISGSSTNVELHDLTIADGVAKGVTVTGTLGPATLGGGILDNQAHLLLSNVTVADCHASGFIGGGGGVASISGATLVVEDGTFTSNGVNGTSVDSPGGAILSDAGSTLSVEHSSFTGNRAIDGGAIGVWGGSQADISTTSFANNQCGSDVGSGTPADNGGAIFAVNESVVSTLAGSTLDVSHCDFTNNTAHGADGGAGLAGGQGAGGAIGVGGVGTVANISHDDFTGNQAVGGSGGAGATAADGGNGGPGSGGALSMADATLNLAHCQFSDNSATGGVGGKGGTGGSGGNGGTGRGGAYVHTVTFGAATPVSNVSDVLMMDNLAMGGAGGAGVNGGNGGNGQGGAIRALLGTIDLVHCQLIGNDAIGGVGGTASTGAGGSGGNGMGGAFLTAFGVTADLSNCQLLSNLAEGGAGAAGGSGGNGQGGGIFNGGKSPFGTPSLTLEGCQVMLNEAEGGAGGVGIGGGVFNVGTFSFDAQTLIKNNEASTSNDDIFP
jgi:hypothetical protein